jgi:RHS repeat-associated protein
MRSRYGRRWLSVAWMILLSLVGQQAFAKKSLRTVVSPTSASFPDERDPSVVTAERGALGYSIPIFLAPAANGYRPRIMLRYDSHSGNGIAGVGWSLAGGSLIGRCAAVRVPDGYHGSLSHTASDRLCLDGARLVPIGGKPYWSAGTEYTTEVRSNLRVISDGDPATPNSFQVLQPDGSKLTYGGPAQAELAGGPGNVTYTWALSRAEDAVGNWYDLAYANTDGVLRLQDARYGANRFGTGAPPYSVHLSYEDRPDHDARWNSASVVARSTTRLQAVSIFVDGALVRNYACSYVISPSSGRSLLTGVTMSGADGTALPAYHFDYQNEPGGTPMWGANHDQSGLHGWGAQRWLADIDGDGMPDYVAKNQDGEIHWDLKQPEDWGGPMNQGGLHTWGAERWFVDISGDGAADYVVKNADGVIHWNLSSGHQAGGVTWLASHSQGGLHGWGVGRWFVDIDGDGRADYVVKNADDQIHWDLSSGDPNTDALWGSPRGQAGLAPWGTQRWFLDLNGDGRVDYVSKSAEGSLDWNIAIGDGTTDNQWAPTQHQEGMHGFGAQRWFVDVNGDGLPDYVAKNADDTIHWNLNLGTSWGPALDQGGLAPWGAARFFADINGDGKADYISVDGAGNFFWNLACGDGTAAPHWCPTAAQGGLHGLGADRWFLDLDGDGAADYLAKNPDGYLHWDINQGGRSDLLVKASSPLRKRIAVEYSYPARTLVGSLGPLDAGTRMLNPAFPMVVRLTTDGNEVLPQTMLYEHGSGIYDSARRRWLGFTETRTTQVERGLTTTHTYGRAFPLDGVEQRETVQVESTHAVLSDRVRSWAVASTGGLWTVELAKEATNQYDPDGVPLAHLDTSYEYDTYGYLTKQTEFWSDGAKKVYAFTLLHDTVHWVLGLVSYQKNQAFAADGSESWQSSETSYDSRGLQIHNVRAAKDAVPLTQEWERDAEGRITLSTIGGSSRTETVAFEYDPHGFVSRKTTNGALPVVQETDPRFGYNTKVVGPNRLATTFAYDSLGRLTSETNPSSGTMTFGYAVEDTGFVIETKNTGSRTARFHYDSFGRLRSSEKVVDGHTVRQRWDYDNRGLLVAVSAPARDADTPALRKLSYDVIGRMVHLDDFDGRSEDAQYSGLAATVRDKRGTRRLLRFDERETLVSISEAGGATLTFLNDANGLPDKAIDATGELVSVTRDGFGRPIEGFDRESGRRLFSRNEFGQVVQVSEDVGRPLEQNTYDSWGRLEHVQRGSRKFRYSYGTEGAETNELVSVQSGKGFLRAFSHNARGLVETEMQRVGKSVLSLRYDYDEAGRLKSKKFVEAGVEIAFQYGSDGTLHAIRDAAAGTTWWRVLDRDAEGHVIQAVALDALNVDRTFATGGGPLVSLRVANASTTVLDWALSYDSGDALEAISDGAKGSTQKFTHDDLGRLVKWDFAHDRESLSRSWDFDEYGNAHPQEVGYHLNFDQSRLAKLTLEGGNLNLARNADKSRWTYDSRGRNLFGGGFLFQYESGNSPTCIVQGAGNRSGTGLYNLGSGKLQLLLDEGEQRVQKVATGRQKYLPLEDWLWRSTRTVYLGDSYIEVSRGSKKLLYAIVKVGGKPVLVVATRTKHGRPMSSEAIALVTDQLGSVLLGARNTGNRESGLVTAEEIYEPYGRSVCMKGVTCLEDWLLPLGFAGGMPDREVGAILMGDREFIPEQARFSAPDAAAPFAHDSRAFNGYAYALGAPSEFVDGNGFEAQSSYAQLGLGVGNMLVAVTVGAVTIMAVGPELAAFEAIALTANLVTSAMMGTGGMAQAIGAVTDLASGNPANEEVQEALETTASPFLVGADAWTLGGGKQERAVARAWAKNIERAVTLGLGVKHVFSKESVEMAESGAKFLEIAWSEFQTHLDSGTAEARSKETQPTRSSEGRDGGGSHDSGFSDWDHDFGDPGEESDLGGCDDCRSYEDHGATVIECTPLDAGDFSDDSDGPDDRGADNDDGGDAEDGGNDGEGGDDGEGGGDGPPLH